MEKTFNAIARKPAYLPNELSILQKLKVTLTYSVVMDQFDILTEIRKNIHANDNNTQKILNKIITFQDDPNPTEDFDYTMFLPIPTKLTTLREKITDLLKKENYTSSQIDDIITHDYKHKRRRTED